MSAEYDASRLERRLASGILALLPASPFRFVYVIAPVLLVDPKSTGASRERDSRNKCIHPMCQHHSKAIG